MEFRKSARLIVAILLAAPWLTSCMTPSSHAVACVEARPRTVDAADGLSESSVGGHRCRGEPLAHLLCGLTASRRAHHGPGLSGRFHRQ
jgi:hypothetical protein